MAAIHLGIELSLYYMDEDWANMCNRKFKRIELPISVCGQVLI